MNEETFFCLTYLWDGVTGASIAMLEKTILMDLTFTSVSIDKTVWLWDGAVGESIAILEEPISCPLQMMVPALP
jgi:hypothetical protein